jgi:cytochrome c2
MNNTMLYALGAGACLLGVGIIMSVSGYRASELESLRALLDTKETELSTMVSGAKQAQAHSVSLQSDLDRAIKIAALENPGSVIDNAPLNLGRAAHVAEVSAWDIDILPDGRGLPEGKGDVWTGEEVFADRCASCHGDFAEGVDNWPALAGGLDTLGDKDPVKTVGSYWPYLSTVWDYVNRSMPFGEAQTLTPDEVYAITAYILYSNDLVGDDFELSHENFSSFEMHNKNGFVIDDRVDVEYAKWRTEPCMTNCKENVEITMRASVLDVTPKEEMKENLVSNPVQQEGSVRPEPVPQSAVTEPEIESASNDDTELIDHGVVVFKKCASCHMVGPNSKTRAGPPLNNIVGAKVARHQGFKYSAAMAALGASEEVWTPEELHAFLASPKTYLPNTKMAFRGLDEQYDRLSLITFLSAFSDLADGQIATPKVVQGFTVAPKILAIDGDVEYGEYLGSECTTCHQASGRNDGIPNIVGLEIEPFVTALHAYREKHRDNPVMQMISGRLADEEIAALAAYFKGLGE